MNKLFRALIAGYGAKKLGGGCFSTILIFILIYWALGNCNSNDRAVRPASLIQENKIAAETRTSQTPANTYYLNK